MRLSSSPFTWIVSGLLLSIISRYNDYAFGDSIERYLFTTMLAIITLSFTAFSLTMNNLAELHKSRRDIKLFDYIVEVESNIKYLLGGLAVSFLAVLLKKSFPNGICSKEVWIFVLNAVILSTVSMFILLVKDIAEAYFVLLKNIYKEK